MYLTKANHLLKNACCDFITIEAKCIHFLGFFFHIDYLKIGDERANMKRQSFCRMPGACHEEASSPSHTFFCDLRFIQISYMKRSSW